MVRTRGRSASRSGTVPSGTQHRHMHRSSRHSLPGSTALDGWPHERARVGITGARHLHSIVVAARNGRTLEEGVWCPWQTSTF